MCVRQTFVKLCACYGKGTVVASNPSDHVREGEVDDENVVPALLQINNFCPLSAHRYRIALILFILFLVTQLLRK